MKLPAVQPGAAAAHAGTDAGDTYGMHHADACMFEWQGLPAAMLAEASNVEPHAAAGRGMVPGAATELDAGADSSMHGTASAGRGGPAPLGGAGSGAATCAGTADPRGKLPPNDSPPAGMSPSCIGMPTPAAATADCAPAAAGRRQASLGTPMQPSGRAEGAGEQLRASLAVLRQGLYAGLAEEELIARLARLLADCLPALHVAHGLAPNSKVQELQTLCGEVTGFMDHLLAIEAATHTTPTNPRGTEASALPAADAASSSSGSSAAGGSVQGADVGSGSCATAPGSVQRMHGGLRSRGGVRSVLYALCASAESLLWEVRASHRADAL